MTNKIQYKAHILLNSKYKLLITLTINLLIIYIYNLSTDNIDIVECMKRAKPSKPSDISSDIDKVSQLTYDNIILKDQLETLTTQYKNDIIEHQSHINQLEKNQLNLLNQIRVLQEQLAEANQNLGRIAGDNMDLRIENSVLKRSNEALRQEIELLQKRNDEFLADLLK